MRVFSSKIPDLKFIEINANPDEREMMTGCFVTYQWNIVRKFVNNDAKPFLSETEMRIKHAGTLRGLYYDTPPRSGEMLIRCIHGSVFQVAVDLRQDKPTYRQWVGRELSAENGLQFYLPEGFAQGFLTLTDDVVMMYKSTNYLSYQFKKIINYSDPLLGINWPQDPVFMSPQVKFAPGVEQLDLEIMQSYIEEAEGLFEAVEQDEEAADTDEAVSDEISLSQELEIAAQEHERIDKTEYAEQTYASREREKYNLDL